MANSRWAMERCRGCPESRARVFRQVRRLPQNKSFLGLDGIVPLHRQPLDWTSHPHAREHGQAETRRASTPRSWLGRCLCAPRVQAIAWRRGLGAAHASFPICSSTPRFPGRRGRGFRYFATLRGPFSSFRVCGQRKPAVPTRRRESGSRSMCCVDGSPFGVNILSTTSA